MDSNNPISFFENLILENRFSYHKENFFREAIDELYNPLLDKENDLIYYYDVNSLGETVKLSFSFQNYLRRLLRKEFKSTIELIDEIQSKNEDNVFEKILNSLVGKIDYISKEGSNLKYFEIAFKPLAEIRNRIEKGYFGSNTEISAIEKPKEPIKVKADYSNFFFYDLYNILIENYIIDEFKVNEEDFFEILTIPNCNKQLKFLVENQIVVTFFEAIKPIFIDFNAKLLENTKRFITKRGSLITQSNYNRNKELSSKNKLLANELTNRISELIAKHS